MKEFNPGFLNFSLATGTGRFDTLPFFGEVIQDRTFGWVNRKIDKTLPSVNQKL